MAAARIWGYESTQEMRLMIEFKVSGEGLNGIQTDGEWCASRRCKGHATVKVQCAVFIKSEKYIFQRHKAGIWAFKISCIIDVERDASNANCRRARRASRRRVEGQWTTIVRWQKGSWEEDCGWVGVNERERGCGRARVKRTLSERGSCDFRNWGKDIDGGRKAAWFKKSFMVERAQSYRGRWR